jgi:hypothetical protein
MTQEQVIDDPFAPPEETELRDIQWSHEIRDVIRLLFGPHVALTIGPRSPRFSINLGHQQLGKADTLRCAVLEASVYMRNFLDVHRVISQGLCAECLLADAESPFGS